MGETAKRAHIGLGVLGLVIAGLATFSSYAQAGTKTSATAEHGEVPHSTVSSAAKQ